jgi:hypothetical protein
LTHQAIEISAIEEVTAWCRFRGATPALDYNPVPSVSATCLGRIEYGTYTTVVINTEVSMKETWFVTGSSVALGRSIAEAALAEGHDVVASARCAGGTDCKERCHEIDPCRTSCSGHGIDRGAAHQPLFQGHAGQHRRRDQHRLSRTFIGLAMYVPADATAMTSADFLIPGIKTDVYTIVLD